MYLLKFLYVGKQIGRYQERLVCPLKQTNSSTHCRANKTDEAVVAQLRPQNPVEEKRQRKCSDGNQQYIWF